MCKLVLFSVALICVIGCQDPEVEKWKTEYMANDMEIDRLLNEHHECLDAMNTAFQAGDFETVDLLETKSHDLQSKMNSLSDENKRVNQKIIKKTGVDYAELVRDKRMEKNDPGKDDPEYEKRQKEAREQRALMGL